MTEYTPTTEEMRAFVIQHWAMPAEFADAAFDRWLIKERAKAMAKVLEIWAGAFEETSRETLNQYPLYPEMAAYRDGRAYAFEEAADCLRNVAKTLREESG